jgi:hypothetical protein
LGGYLVAFVKTITPSKCNFLEGFWPLSNWKSNYARVSLSTIMDIVDVKNPIQIPYCGLKNMRPLIAYTPFRDLNVEDFVLVRLHNPDLVLLWMGRIEGDVVKDKESEYFKMVRVQWWVPMKK